MKRYHIGNLDCAACAVTIEESLRKLESVRFVSISVASSTMDLETENLEEAVREIKRIEPEAKVSEITDRRQGPELEEPNVKRQFAIAGISAALFLVGLKFEESLHATPYSIAEYAVFLTAYLLSGWKVLLSAGRNILRGRVFDENFLMTVATMGAVAIHQLPEAAGVMIFFKVGELFQDLSVSHSRRSIKALLETRPDYANLKAGGTLRRVAPEELSVGDEVVVKPGEKFPVDGLIVEGGSQVDTSALTGESVPRLVEAGDSVLAGMINKTKMLTVRVSRPFSESSISHIMDLVQNAVGKKAKTEKFITRFARYYTPVVVGLASAVAILPPLLAGAAFSEWLYRALILLVISCPCALVISIPLGYFGGIGGASKRGILVKGSNYLDVLNKVKTVVFDKTGTLTRGVFKVTEVVPKNGFSEQELLTLAAETESHSNHPIAISILEAYGRDDPPPVDEYEELAGLGIKARAGGRSLLAGNDRLLHMGGIEHDVCDVEGTVVHVAADNRYAGYLVIGDQIKEDAEKAISALRRLGVNRISMLTGDNEAAARAVSRKLDLDSFRADLLPEEKVSVVEGMVREREENERIAFVGDGINDAPVIAQADVGIAMGETGSDAAIDIADVVLMTGSPLKVAEAIQVARKTHRIVWQNIILAFLI
ncbi:MAG TPA: heavy metal translocating P-type ATPase, partial [Spirochaetia bacterium]|nr:heavy metal translocating P-type ATPase [Spirochaetia bacterium]